VGETEADNKTLFDASEAVTSVIFMVDYICRVAVITEKACYGRLGPLLGRLRYMLTISALIDAISAFPYFIELAIAGSFNFPNLTYIRFLLLFRLLKTDQYFHTVEAASRVFYYNREILVTSFCLCLAMLVFTSILIYYLGPQKILDDVDYSSIPNTMYIAVLMLTGEWAPTTPDLTWYSMLAQGLTAFFSVGVFTIPAAMLTWGFEAEAARLTARRRVRALAAKKAAEGTQWYEVAARMKANTLPDSSSDDSDWDEYESCLAGDEGEESDTEKEDNAKLMDQVHELIDEQGLAMQELQAASADTTARVAALEETLNVAVETLQRIEKQLAGKTAASI